VASDREQPPENAPLIARVWRSIFPGPVLPASDRDRKWIVFNTLLLHLRPIRVPANTIRYTHTFGLGGMSLLLVLLLMGTGALLMFVYEPSSGGAHGSIAGLESDVLFGPLVRGVHYWCANLIVVVVTLHLLRVLLTGAFHPPRQFNWIVGLTLLACVLTSNFTGYLLPWDQRSYWAVTIVTGMVEYVPVVGGWLQRVMRAGPEIGTSTIINFYTIHTTLVPVLLISFMGLHFWRVRKAGGVIPPEPPADRDGQRPRYVLFLPHLLMREVAVALALFAVVLVLAIVFRAPLGEGANPGMSPNPAKAPWYFMGFQELLLHFDPLFAVVVIPLVVIAALVLLPYLRYRDPLDGPWFLSDTGRRTAVLALVTGVVITPVWVLLDEYFVDPGALFPSVSPVLSYGVLPFVVFLGVVAGFSYVVRRRLGAGDSETVQALFILLLIVFAVFTLTGVWFRGTGMALTWPWNT
jgi:quinol-cytochrome oxidoreductase complex cytochrome b subunit